MGLTFLELSRELINMVSFLDPTLAARFINRAYRDVRDARPWSFLIGEGALFAPSLVSDGTVTVTQFSQIVTGNATAQTVWNAMANPIITQRQFRLAGGGGEIYNISEYDGAGNITLDRNYLEQSGAGQSYQIYRCYFFPTSGLGTQLTDFDRFMSVKDPSSGYILRLGYSYDELDAVDPLRGAASQPVLVASYKADASGYPLYELWPHPTTARGYPFIYRRQGTDLSASTDTLPAVLTDRVVLERAKYLSYEWAEAHRGDQPQLRAADWRYLMAQIDNNNPRQPRGTYQLLLQQAKMRDDDIFLRNYRPSKKRGGYRLAPIDARFAQRHDINFYW